MAESKNAVDVSIVIPVYSEEGSLNQLYAELNAAMDASKKSWEAVFVDDGSADGSLRVLKEIQAKNPGRVKIIVLQRNFGKSAALSAGFEHSSGSVVVTMDADLQDVPSEIPKLAGRLEEDFDLVVGWRKDRKDSLSKKIPSRLFNMLTRTLTGVKVHDSNCGFKAYRRVVVENIGLYGELHRYIPSLANWQGYRVGEAVVTHRPRTHGSSKYNVWRISKGLLDLITVTLLTTYFRRPMHLFGLLGTLITLGGFAMGAYLIYLKFLLGEAIGGRPILNLTVLLLVLGVQFFSMGFIGEMLTRGSGRKAYVVREVLGRGA
jgi:glycosyltransferase involved in cell wall biosynthesis